MQIEPGHGHDLSASGSVAMRSRESSALDGGVLLSSLLLISVGVVMSYSGTAPLAMRESLPPLFLQHVTALVAGLSLVWALAASVWVVPRACFVRRIAAEEIAAVEVDRCLFVWRAFANPGGRRRP